MFAWPCALRLHYSYTFATALTLRHDVKWIPERWRKRDFFSFVWFWIQTLQVRLNLWRIEPALSRINSMTFMN